jgi:hypothetical protein
MTPGMAAQMDAVAVIRSTSGVGETIGGAVTTPGGEMPDRGVAGRISPGLFDCGKIACVVTRSARSITNLILVSLA